MKIRQIVLIFLLCALVAPHINALPEPARGKRGMVASQHELASKIGIDILKKGGNAVDAAIAVGLALAVVYPEAGNIGGGGFMLIREAGGGAIAIDYRETAPGNADRDVFIDDHGNLITGEGSSTIGYRAAGVPGTLAGFDLAFRKYGSGRVTWKQLVEPARLLARNGYALSHRLAELLKEYKEHLAKYPDSKRIFLNNGKYYKEGDVLRQPELATTLSRIQTLGAREFYTGQTARLIAADMKANNGLITLADLKNYQAKERTPLRGSYRGHEIITMPPPSSGGIVMLQMLNMLEGYDVSRMGHNSSEKYHLLTEASKRAFADRAVFMADPDFANVPVAALVDKDYAKKRISNIDPTRATPARDIREGVIDVREAGIAVRVSSPHISKGSSGRDEPSLTVGLLIPGVREGTETTHYTIVDKDGTVVSNTYTINDLYGSRVTVRGTGILLNDEMDDFAAKPGKPNLYGLIQGEQNAVQPGKRPLSSMTPTIVLRKDGRSWFALGARGGPRIISTVTQSVINIIDHDMDIQQAINSPRVHHQWLPDEIMHEPYGLSPDTMNVLLGFGHKFIEKPAYVASATGIMIDPVGVRLGAVDSRSDGAAVGY